jgi:exodeoxyribonuclease V gamma subunit
LLVVHRSADGAALAAALGEVLAQPPSDPFAREIVAVPAKGVERWLAQRLSHVLGAGRDDGVCANVAFPRPSILLDETVQEALGAVAPDAAGAVEQWSAQRVVWPLLEVIDASVVSEPWCRALAQHLGSDSGDIGDIGDKGRRMVVASRLARLFDDYAQSRPEMLRSWAAGDDTAGDGVPLPEDLRWQAELWRHLRRRLGVPSPAELLEPACRVLRDGAVPLALPERLSVFGASRLSRARMEVLAALAVHRDVHLWLHHASPALWETARAAEPAVRRAADTARRRLAHPLLSSLARDVLELQQLLARTAPDARDVLHATEPTQGTRGTLLAALKADLAADRLPTAPPPYDGRDRSVQVHACHGRTRQVEVLREVVVGLLADDPTLEPRDVLIMCPDIETFAPMIAATFSLEAEDGAAHPAAALRVRLADRALRQTNDLLAVLGQLLELGTSRVTASQVLDLAGAPAVRQRFGFDDDDMERLRDWTVGAGIRWGLDADHRGGWSLGAVSQGTWRAGLDRLLLGVAMEGTNDGFGGVVPLDDVDSSDIDLAGRLAELVDRVAAAQRLMAGAHTPQAWTTGLHDAVTALADTTYETAWQQIQLRAELADIAQAAEGSDTLLRLADVRALLAPVLAGRPTRASFRTGTLTVCTLVPMRSVPHRVVCLLGLDDGVFPRETVRDGDDVLARDPWVGERDPRSEDRQLLLDAISAAGERLVITYTGADERTGAPVPPAVPLGELLDALDRTATAPDGRRVRDAITTWHPLQPFDARNFVPGALGVPGPFSFDPLGHEGATAAAGPREEPRPTLDGPLPRRPPSDVDLVELHRLLEHPARGFLRQRLQVAQTRTEEEPADALPIDLDGLETWNVGERLLRLRLGGLAPGECMTLEQQRGELPPGALGVSLLRTVGRQVEAVLASCTAECGPEPAAYDVDVALADGTRLSGTVRDVRDDVLLTLTYSRLAAKHRLSAWIDLVALTAAQPDREWRAVAVGRGRGGAERCDLGPLRAQDAERVLGELVGLYRSGLCAPLPAPLKTAAEYARLRHRGIGVPAARRGAESTWEGGSYPGERADAEHVLLHGADAGLDVLTRQRPGADESGPSWHADETDRFGRVARRLWQPLLDAETAAREAQR